MQTCNALVVVVVAVLVSRKHIAHSLCFALTLAGCKRRNGETDTMSVFVLPVFIYFEMHDIFFACGRNGLRNGLFVCKRWRRRRRVNINNFVCEIEIEC